MCDKSYDRVSLASLIYGRTMSRETRSPRVSVVTTFLNARPFIEETIASVLAQDFTDFEYILVDDGSTPMPAPG